MAPALLQTNLGSLAPIAQGKVRDIYSLSGSPSADERLLFVATDRISAFDHVLGTGIPDKGKILTQLSLFWFDFLSGLTPNHLLTADANAFPAALAPFRDQLAGRSMIVKRVKMFPVECVVRGYLSGSGWKDYQATGVVCGIPLPSGLRESERLPEPIFTPAAKNNVGHDENISFATMDETLGGQVAEELRARTLSIYKKASDYAATKGLILADTKFEFGLIDDLVNGPIDGAARGEIVLADEVLTPDSSRYWPADTYEQHLEAGRPQPSFDKQYVRDYLERLGWNKQAPAPSLPDDVVDRTRAKYMDAFRLLTGRAELAA